MEYRLKKDLPFAKAGENGMDLRDYFAAKAMEGILSNSQVEKNLAGTESTPEEYRQVISELSYKFANAMMKAREVLE